MRTDNRTLKHRFYQELWFLLLLTGLLVCLPQVSSAANVRDQFDARVYSNNDGSNNWNGDWIEIGEGTNPTGGSIRVISLGSEDYTLRIRNNNRGARRAVNLLGATGVSLSFDYRRISMESSDYVSVEVTDNGGTNWTEITRIQGTGSNDSSFQSFNQDISTLATADTQVRFVAHTNNGNDTVYFDNIDITYTAVTPITANLLAHWWLDGNGVEYFSGVDAVPVGAPGYAVARVCDGFFGDGSGFLTSNADPQLDLPDEFTAMAWINASSLSVSGHDTLYSFFSKDTNFEVHVRNTGEVFWWYQSGTLSTPAGTIVPGNWYHVAIVHSRSGAYQRIYINGVLTASDNRAISMPVNDDLFLIGGDIATGSSSEITGRRWYGLIDEVKVYDGPLTTGQIVTEMAATRVCSPPAAEWRFDECVYTNAADEAIDSSTGTYPGTSFNNVTSAGPGVVQRYADLSDTGVRDNHFELRNTQLPMTGSWTVSTWFQTPFTGTHRYHVLGAMNGGGDILFLDRNNNYRWGVYTPGTIRNGTYQFGNLSNGWHHLALVGSGGSTDLYVDGSYVDTVTLQATGNLEFIGTSYDYVGSPTNAQGFGTPLDEFLVFSEALDATQVRSIFSYNLAGSDYNGRPRATINCNPAIDHFRLERSSASGLTCAASPITVRACEDATCSSEYATTFDVTLNPTSGWTGGNTKIGVSSGDSFNLRNNTGGTVTLGVASSTPTASNAVQCLVGGVPGSCDMTFNTAGFLMDVQDFPSCDASAQVTLSAVRQDLTSEQCVGIDSFASTTKTIDFHATRNNPNNGTQDLIFISGSPSTNTTLNTYASGSVPANPGTGVAMTFDANARSTFSVRYSDAGRMQLYANYTGVLDEAGLTMAEISSDTFVVYPSQLNVVATTNGSTQLNSTTPTGSVHWPAGEDFQVDVEAVCADGTTVTPSFIWTVDLAAAAPNQPGVLGTLITSQIPAGSFSNGQASGTTAYSEVGTFTLNATADDYLGVSSLDISGTAGEIGRFTPFEFTVAPNTPVFSAANDTFTYLGQPFSYQTAPQVVVTARNKQGTVTQNYEGSWWRMTDTSIGWGYSISSGALDTGGATVSVTPTGNGVGTIDFGGSFLVQRTALVGPFEAEIQLDVNVIDQDSIAYATNPVTFGGITASNGIDFADGSGLTVQANKTFLFGRLAIHNAYGSELLPLTVPIRTEFYDGNGFTLNTDDNSTNIQDGWITLTNSVSGTANAGTPIDVVPGIPTTGTWGNQPFVAGNGGFSLTAPGVGGTGEILLSVDLSALGWLRYDWANLDEADDGPYDQDPTGRASFGLYRGSPRLIYRRESIN